MEASMVHNISLISLKKKKKKDFISFIKLIDRVSVRLSGVQEPCSNCN